MNNHQHPLRQPGLKSTLLPDGHLVISNPANQEAITLNPVGAIVWEFCDGGTTVDEIIAEVVALSGGSLTDVDDHVRMLLKELENCGLLTFEDAKSF
jgi:hypothetical protein